MQRLLRHLLLLLCLLLSAYPLLWMTLASLRTDADVLEHPFAWPSSWQLRSYGDVLAAGGFGSASDNLTLLLAAFPLAAAAFLWMADLVQFRLRLWHLPFLLALGGALLAAQRHPALHRALQARPGFANAYLNSLTLCIAAVTAAVMLAALAAFALSRLKFRGSNLLFLTFMLGMMIPVHVTLIPLNLLLGPQLLNLKGSPWALVGPYVAFAIPVSVLILRNAFDAIPADLLDAAQIDGCTPWLIFRHIAIPLANPALATLVIFNFLTCWNEFAFALTLADSRRPTLPIALHHFKGEQGSLDIPVICAALVISVAPLLIVYACAQRHIIRGLTAGAVKE